MGDALASAQIVQELGYAIAPRPWTVFRAELAEYANLARCNSHFYPGVGPFFHQTQQYICP